MADLVKVEVIRAFQDHSVGDVITVQPNQVQALTAMNLIKLALDDDVATGAQLAETEAKLAAEKKPKAAR